MQRSKDMSGFVSLFSSSFFFHKLRLCTFFFLIFLGCVLDPVGVSDSSAISDQRFSSSSSLSGSSPSDGRLNGSNSWIPATNNYNNDFLQIDLGSLYFVCGVATQGNPTNDYWTKTYKIKTCLLYTSPSPRD